MPILPEGIDKGVDKSAREGHNTAHPGLSRLDRPTACSGPGSGRAIQEAPFGGRRRSRSQEQAVGRRRRRRVGQLEEGGHHLQGPVPVPRREDTVVRRHPGARDAGTASAAGWAATSSASSCSATASTFPEALRTLAQRAGVEIDERTKREDAHKARLRQVLDSAIAFYHAVLTGSRPASAPSTTCTAAASRTTTIEAHQLGWAPAGWDQMTRPLPRKRDIRPEELVEVGLASPRQNGRGGVYDKFRARVLFPIRDQNGHAVGLGGRLLEGEGPKYLNSPATPLFDKSRTLYLIDKAKGPIRKSGQAVIVEGYTDALMAHQAGFDNVVASLGTALTPGQVALLTRYASRIVLAYDVDAAGEKAGTLGVTALAGLIGQLQGDASGVKLEDVRVARLPDGQGPRRGRPRDAGRLGDARSPRPSRSSSTSSATTPSGSTSRPRPAGSASSRRSCRPSATSPIRCAATRRSARSAACRASRSACCARCSSDRLATRSRTGRPGGEPRRRVAHQRGRRARRRRTRCRPRHPAGGHAGRGRAAAAAAARPGPAAPRRRRARTGPAAEHASRASCSARSSCSARRTTRASTRRSTATRCCSRSTTKRRALARGVVCAVGRTRTSTRQAR